jgi:S1-C subfamily serine protease
MTPQKQIPLAVIVVASFVMALVLAGCGGGGNGNSKTGTSATTGTGTVAASSAEKLVAKVRSGIIRIQTATCDGTAIGTGFVIGPRLVATVEHVIDGATGVSLIRDGRVVGHATVIGEDPARDVALLQSSKPISGYQFQLADRAPQLAEDVIALGFPFGLPLTVTKGSVSGLDRSIPIASVRRRQLVQTDAALNPGNSGGPLLATDTGQVVGLVDLGTDQANGISFAVSSGVAGPLLKAWQVAPQPLAHASCGGLPAPTGGAGSAASGDLGGYVTSVARLLEESAAVRKQLVSAVAAANTQPVAAQQTLAAVVAARRDEAATAEAMASPSGTAATQAALVRAFELSLASDLLYQQWASSRSQALLARAQANDTATVAAKSAFMVAYNNLRTAAGFSPLPSDFPF